MLQTIIHPNAFGNSMVGTHSSKKNELSRAMTQQNSPKENMAQASNDANSIKPCPPRWCSKLWPFLLRGVNAWTLTLLSFHGGSV